MPSGLIYAPHPRFVPPPVPHRLPAVRPRILIVIPARDEAATLGDLLVRLRDLPGCRTIVASDQSTDATASLARAHGVQVLDIALQLGAWGVTQAGLRYAQRNGYEAVVTLDGDGQHDPAAVPRLIAEQRRTGADVLIGTCPQRLSRGRRLAWAWFRAITGLRIEDLTSGFRVYGPQAIRILASREATLLDYQDVGVLLLMRKYGLTLHETPVTMFPRCSGRSKVFSSWLIVGYYMLQTTVICLARTGRLRAPPPRPLEV
jgi:glycosyltransferase involved in cell wall biosynthesis